MTHHVEAVFVLEVDGAPTLSFAARNFTEAFELCRERWLRADLQALTSEGRPLWQVGSQLKVRRARQEEARRYHEGAELAEPSDELILTYLVELDAQV